MGPIKGVESETGLAVGYEFPLKRGPPGRVPLGRPRSTGAGSDTPGGARPPKNSEACGGENRSASPVSEATVLLDLVVPHVGRHLGAASPSASGGDAPVAGPGPFAWAWRSSGVRNVR